MNRSPFGEKLRRLRRDADLTLVDLADAIGVSVAYLSALERGTRPPPARGVIEKLLAKLRRSDQLEEMILLAAKSRRSVEFKLDGSDSDVVTMLTALARRKEEGTLTSEEAQMILRVLNPPQKTGED